MRSLALSAIAVVLGASLSVALLACGSDDAGGTAGSGGLASGGSGGLAAGGGGLAAGGSSGAGSGGLGSGGVSADYPAGPYGNAVGDTIANLAWEGYVNETADAPSDTKPYVDYGTDGMRKSGKKYGLIHVSLSA